MKYNKVILMLAVLLTIQFNALAQSSKRFEVQSFSIQAGLLSEMVSSTTSDDFKNLAPDSKLLNQDLSGFSNFSNYNQNDFHMGMGQSSLGYNFNERFRNSPSLNISLGLKINPKEGVSEKFNKMLRLGIGFYSGNGLNLSLYNTNRKTYDRFTSVQTGQTVELDSVNSKIYNLNYISQQIRFDAALIFRTVEGKRCSFYAGIGLNGGVSINSETNIYYTNNHFTEARIVSVNRASDGPYFDSEDVAHESFKNKSQTAFSAYIPIGVERSLSKKRELLKNMHFFYEMRPGVNITMIPELSTQSNFSFHHGFGLRYSLSNGK